MAVIEDPWHSRPIDVHRWSDHPEVVQFVDRIWNDYLPNDRTVGPKPKAPFRHQLRVLVLDLYVAWLEDPELCIGVSMSSNYWDTSSRYNAIHLSKKIIPIIQALAKAGLIDLARGSFSGPFVRGNRTTRIRASEELQTWFAEAAFQRDDVGRAEGEDLLFCVMPKVVLPWNMRTTKTLTACGANSRLITRSSLERSSTFLNLKPR